VATPPRQDDSAVKAAQARERAAARARRGRRSTILTSPGGSDEPTVQGTSRTLLGGGDY
jgi:hypothetical protein